MVLFELNIFTRIGIIFTDELVNSDVVQQIAMYPIQYFNAQNKTKNNNNNNNINNKNKTNNNVSIQYTIHAKQKKIMKRKTKSVFIRKRKEQSAK